MVESKFKIGDWIVYDDNLYNIGNIALQRYYECLKVDGTVHTFSLDIDSKSHLWTIANAKDGDMLHCWIDGDEFVLIYKGIKGGYITTYCHLYQKLKLFAEKPTTMFCRTVQGYFTPATKEQRDLLFQKMKEVGYIWDAEKKELKKMEELYDIFQPLDKDLLGVASIPTTDEIRNKNYNKMHSLLDSKGYRMTYKMRKCADGEEYEITEIRGPKASGFFFAENYGLRASDFLYTLTSFEHKHLTIPNGENFFIFLKFLCECKEMKQQQSTPPPDRLRESTPVPTNHTGLLL